MSSPFSLPLPYFTEFWCLWFLIIISNAFKASWKLAGPLKITKYESLDFWLKMLLICTSQFFKLSVPHSFFHFLTFFLFIYLFSLCIDVLEMKTSTLVWFNVCTSGICQFGESKYVNMSCLNVMFYSFIWISNSNILGKKKISFWLICGNINLQINTGCSSLAFFFFKFWEFAFMVPIISRWQDMMLKSMGK